MGIRLSEYFDNSASLSTKMAGGGISGNTPVGGFETKGMSTQVWWKVLTLEGRLKDINRALAGFTYRPDLNWNSVPSGVNQYQGLGFVPMDSSQLLVLDFLQLHVEKVAVNPLRDVPEEALVEIPVEVFPANDAPVLTVPNPIYSATLYTEDKSRSQVSDSLTWYATEDTPLPVPGFSVSDVDVSGNGFMRLTIEAEHGTITFTNTTLYEMVPIEAMRIPPGLLVEHEVVENEGYRSLEVVGTIDYINRALDELTFNPAPNYYGYDARLNIAVADMGNMGVGGVKQDSHSLRIYVDPVNDSPTIKTPATSGEKPIFILDGNEFIRLIGASNVADGTATSDRHYVKRSTDTGFELWRLNEPIVESTSSEGSVAVGDLYEARSDYVQLYPHAEASLAWDSRQYADIYHGPSGSNPRFFTVYNNALYFQADDGMNGKELWRDMGSSHEWQQEDPSTQTFATVTGTTSDIHVGMFVDLLPGSGGSEPSDLEVHNGYLYFSSAGIDTSWMVLPQYRDDCGSLRQSSFDPDVFFAVSDSTTWEPDRVYDCPQGYHWASTEEGHRHFTSYQLNSPIRQWHAISPREGLGDERLGIQEYTQRSDGEYEKATSIHYNYEEKVYFDECGWQNYDYGGATRTHFRFRDSYKTGEYKHAGRPDSYRPDIDDAWAHGNKAHTTANFAGIVCISGPDPLCRGHECDQTRSGHELWRTDGTAEGTTRVEDINPGEKSSSPSDMASFGSYLYFAATSLEHGRELWRTTGTTHGTAEMISFKGAGTGIYAGIHSSNPQYLTVADNSDSSVKYLFFSATDQVRGREVWYIEYTVAAGTYDLQYVDIESGTGSSAPDGYCSSNGKLPIYFTAYDSTNGRELWVSDGTEAGTTIVADINSGSESSDPAYLIYYKGLLYFQANDGVSGKELWASDGTSSGTVLIADIRPGSGDGTPSFLTAMTSLQDGSSYLMMIANDGALTSGEREGIGGSQIWRSDGTEVGTYRSFQRTQNDFYIDFDSLGIQHPSRMPVFDDALYISARFSSTNRDSPVGGLSYNNEEMYYDDSYALIVDDIDTAADGNLTMTLEVSSGLIVLDAATYIPPSSQAALKIAVAESNDFDRGLIVNALLELGHSVDIYTSAQDAFNATQEKYSQSILFPDSETARQYDCLLVNLHYHDSNLDDGIQMARLLRIWESSLDEPDSYKPIKIIIMAKKREFAADPLLGDVLSAGIDTFFYLPQSEYLPTSDSGSTIVTINGTSETRGTRVLREQYEKFGIFAQQVSDFLTVTYRAMNITAEIDAYEQPSSEKLAELPGAVAGNKIHFEGTIADINKAMKKLFYYAPQGTNGNITYTVTVSDQPLGCESLYGAMIPTNPNNFVQRPSRAILPTTDEYGMFGNSSNLDSICDRNRTRTTVAYLPVYVVAVNQAPTISTDSEFYSQVQLDTPVPEITITDVNHEQMTRLTSMGEDLQPSVTLTITAGHGKITLLVKDNVVFLQGVGRRDQAVIIGAPIDVMNNVLKTLSYSCKFQDGCVSDMIDTIYITVDDEGYRGKGGALTASATITVHVT